MARGLYRAADLGERIAFEILPGRKPDRAAYEAFAERDADAFRAWLDRGRS